ncbi:MAG: hypothetical protein DI564_08615 [Rhodanobacter denitrificans]|uniref:Uncharacterized protein n=1 Tax=Rhodanobacter denitrificans TaxID=666685 RepID=A0A2W5KHC5_9GAMM|nr:MAG: hypothetical protein DI564_08615 [Rhodanobacter denitrificans]
MLPAFPRSFPPDDVEARIASADDARRLTRPDAARLAHLLSERLGPLLPFAGPQADRLPRVADAIVLAHARTSLRHGRLGDDYHAYHCEDHILEILDGRIGRLLAHGGLHALGWRDWCALALFAATHDLRQREAPQRDERIGANERASIEEAWRILDACGLSRADDEDFYVDLALMIGGSTFDARRSSGPVPNAAEMLQTGGALAPSLPAYLDLHDPHWRERPHWSHAAQLALIAADLDTANVAEPFLSFLASGERLCREREMLCGRRLDAAESATPVLRFLTDAQEAYFFELHRFHSQAGRHAFAAGKHENAPRLRALCAGVRARVAAGAAPPTGEAAIALYRSLGAVLAERPGS